MGEKVKGGLAGLWRRLRPTTPAEGPIAAKKRLETLSDRDLARLIPHPDWEKAAPVLASAVASRLEASASGRAVITVTGPPHSGNAEILERFAALRKWQLIAPPPAEGILSCDRSWLERLLDEDSPWVLPRLEICYLRHVRGLAVIRGLAAAIQGRRTGPAVIGCDTWARAYLQHAVPGLLRNTHTVQAFDYERLARWLQAPAGRAGGRPAVFRQQENGACVLALTAESEGGDDGLFLRNLAAYSRGNPGVALTLWRCALRTRPQSDEAAAAAQGDTVWVLPWNRLRQPAAEAVLGGGQLPALHALLLHGGLPAERLAGLLPLSGPAVIDALAALERIELIESFQGAWRVSALGYPQARRLIHEAGYLADDF